ncbi:MAG: fused MFS/spermidine synthase [Deltaproteobacteria bacterium]|jgi:spermidine synthase|nr:fused MFS/spermidine synthase [Deltaproteobacteria bacterium]
MSEPTDNKFLAGIKPFLRSLWAESSLDEPATVYEGDSPYHHITIMDTNGIRTLYLGPKAQEAETSISLSNPEAPIFEYPGMMFLALALAKNTNILMLGLGGGFIPNIFKKYLPAHNLTVVEIDPLVAELAEVYFGFSPGENVRLVIKDGFDYISEIPDGGFDQIWLDAFGGRYIPENLATAEFLEFVRRKIAIDGLLVQNLHQTASNVYDRQLWQTKELFGEIPLMLGGKTCANTVAISLNSEVSLLPKTDHEIIKAVNNFQLKVGPYDLLDQVPKMMRGSPKPPSNFLKGF